MIIMQQPKDDKIASLRRQLAHYVCLLQEEANNYFLTVQQQKMSGERKRDYAAWHAAYVQLQRHLQNPESVAEENATEENKKELIITAKNIAINTTLLFKTLAETPETGDDTYNPKTDQLKKVAAIATYHQQCQVMPKSPSILRTLGRVALGVTLGALGFALGAAGGAALGAITGLASAIFSGGNPGMALLSIEIGAIVGGIGGGIGLGYVGFMIGWHALAPKLPDPSKSDLETKAMTFANTSMTFFAGKNAENTALQKNRAAVNTPIQHTQNNGGYGYTDWANNKMQKRHA